MARITLADRLTTLTNDENLTQRDRDFAESLLAHLRKKKSLTRGRRVWVDRLEARAAEAAKAPKGEVPADMKALHEKIVEREGASSWSAGFIESIMEQVKRGRTLSERQRAILDEKREEYTGSWTSEYRSDYREHAVLIARYYKTSGLPYYGHMVGSILSNEEYVPSKRAFLKMYKNRYAQRVVEQASAAPVYAVRDCVQMRSNHTTRAKYSRYIGKKAFVVAVGGIIEAAKGGRGYTILFLGDPKPIVVEERYIMKARR